MKTTRTVIATIPIAFTLALACGGDGDRVHVVARGGSGGEAGEVAAAGSGGDEETAGAGNSEAAGAGGSTGGSAPTAGEAGQPVGGTGGTEPVAGSAGEPATGGTVTAGAAGTAGTGGTTGPLCAGYMDPCETHADCCSNMCNPDTGLCTSALVECVPAGASCEYAIDCCNQVCIDNICGDTPCISDDQACDSNDECCSGSCVDGVCEPLNPSCLTGGNDCTDGSECCSQLCLDGKCEEGASWCVQPGDVCVRDADCCSAVCNVSAGDTLGTCGPPPEGNANCDGVEGMICDSCNDCCSRLCVPYGPYGVFACQPAQGCRVVGDICRTTADCCGGIPDAGLPGWEEGKTDCVKESPDAPLGICRNPTGCKPQGSVCHYKPEEGDYPCTVSAAANSCCGDTGGQLEMCQLDALGVPRCNGLSECVPTGGICSSSVDCCDEVPCVPWDDGLLHCGPQEGPPDECIPLGGPCTIDADCCPPYTCIRPPGSTQGTCGTFDPPPGGAGGQGGAPSEPCHLYGQICDNDADCCNDVPCTDGICKFPIG